MTTAVVTKIEFKTILLETENPVLRKPVTIIYENI